MAIKDEFHPLFLQLPPRNIVLLKFLLESYEGIAELRTLDKDKAVVSILAMKDTLPIVQTLLDSEISSLEWKLIDKPENLDGDWLLSNFE